MQKSTTFTTIFRVKKCYFHYDFACKKVPLSLRYAKKLIWSIDSDGGDDVIFYNFNHVNSVYISVEIALSCFF
jgi:hypothetical protein